MKGKLKFIVLITLLISLGIYTGCANGDSKENQSELTEVKLMLPFIPQIQWAAYYAAQQNGYYAEEGLEVEIQYSTQGGAGPLEQLIAGKVDFVLTNTDNVITAREKGLDVVAVYLIEPTNVFYLVSEKDKSIIEPANLLGKTVGSISFASNTYTNLLVMLDSANLNIDDIEVVQAGTALVPSFLEGKFDAAAVHLSQRLLIEDEGLDLNVIKAADYSDVSNGHIAVTSSLINNNPEVIRKFLRATEKGIEYATSNPQEAVEIYISRNPEAESKREVSQELWNAFIASFGYETNISGTEIYQKWEESQDSLYNIGLLTDKTDVLKMYTNDFIPE